MNSCVPELIFSSYQSWTVSVEACVLLMLADGGLEPTVAVQTRPPPPSAAASCLGRLRTRPSDDSRAYTDQTASEPP